MSLRRRIGLSAALALAALAAMPPVPAAAHGLVGRADLPVPMWLFAWAGGLVLIISFAALGLLWRTPRLQRPRERRLVGLGPWVDVVGGAVGVATFALVVVSGLAGTDIPTANFAPTAVYVVFWVGIPVASALVGDVFRIVSPWRAIARAVAWLAARLRAAGGAGALPAPLAYPRALGHWPAVVTIAGFAWLELVAVNRDQPRLLAFVALGYAAVQFIGMSVWGIEAWSRRGDGFAVLFGLYARLAPLVRRDGALWLRRPLDGLPGMEVLPGTVPLLCVTIGATTFDGASAGPLWTSLAPSIQSWFAGLGLGATAAGQAAFTVGLLAGFAVAAAVYLLGVVGMRLADGDRSVGELAREFVHSLVPIAFGYALAHYLSLLIFQGQAVAYLLSDPLGDGSDLFGTAGMMIDYTVIGATGIWYLQIGVIVLGHIGALVLAHDRALAAFRRRRGALRSQVVMLGMMVAFTGLALWLISAANS